MPEKKSGKKKKMHPLGCLAIFVVVGALIVGVGAFFAKRDDAKRTPCQRYAKVIAQALDNCHSGANRSHRHHIGICEKRVNATPECLKKIRSLSCQQLERNPVVSAGEVCAKK